MLIKLNQIDSTNNYAMQLIDGNTAHHGLTILSATQTSGKGQRGKTWVDVPGDSLLMSTVIQPRHLLHQQALFNASVAVAIAETVEQMGSGWHVQIKWPNDIIINDKKAGGILIENVLRGQEWAYAVVGVGLNVNQEVFDGLPFATSLRLESGQYFEINALAEALTRHIVGSLNAVDERCLERYNSRLYKRDQQQLFEMGEGMELSLKIEGTDENGYLMVTDHSGTNLRIRHGQYVWKYQ